MRFSHVFILAMLLLSMSLQSLAQETKSLAAPVEFFGFEPGTDRELFDYEQLINYLKLLETASDRIKLVEIGKSPMGRTMYVAFFSSSENLRDLDRLKEINRRLALDPAIPKDERETMVEEGKVFVLATLSMHSNEVGPSQAAPLIAYELVTTIDPEKLEWMDHVVFMMVPSHNPDGMDMIVEHYKKYKGTKYEGCSMPGVYHKYVGHDNNRDFITLSQQDTRAISSIYSLEWFPQVMVEKHQMGSTGVRYFVPPPHDPIAENVDAGVWNWIGVFGSNMITDMTDAGLTGIAQRYLFDDYWPGSTETCIWKNVIGFLTEGANVQLATPIYIEPNEIRVGGKGLSEYKKSINMPQLWPGGWWRLTDLVGYEITSTFSILKTASLYHRNILEFRNDLCRKEVQKGMTEPPYYYILPLQQHDPGELVLLVDLLMEHNSLVYQLISDLELEGIHYHEGDLVIPLSQPFRPLIKEVMERQFFPVRHYTPDGELIKPYDITSWSLPLHRGLKVSEINKYDEKLMGSVRPVQGQFTLAAQPVMPYDKIAFPAEWNESYKMAFLAKSLGLSVDRLSDPATANGFSLSAGSFIVNKGSGIDQLLNGILAGPVYLPDSIQLNTKPFVVPRIALVETWFHDMDAGWTRFVFDQYHIPFEVIRPGDFEKTDLAKQYDVIVFPAEDKSILMTGKYKAGDDYIPTSYPPDFTKGMGDKGMEKLMVFLDNGGIILSWGESVELFAGPLTIKHSDESKEDFKLPFNDISATLRSENVYCPGSLLNVELAKNHPLTTGLPSRIGVFSRGTPTFSTQVPVFDMDRRVIAKYPEREILISGYVENEEKLGNKSAMIWLQKGKGQLVLYGFNPLFRASTQASYKLLFNALLLPRIETQVYNP
jgi:hypothetical protein